MIPFPEDGAIFMANQSTREECFRRKLFGLPTTFSEFVLNVKRGMFLFLFDYHQRKLYGVFEAITDGGLNLVPDAYKSSNMRFPAQVHFNVVWECNPLQENDFRDVIADNYYTKNKFNFGLSRVQVDGLLFLFRKAKIQHSCTSNSRGNCISVFQRLGDQPEVIKEKSVSASENMRYRTSQIKNAISVASGTLKRKTGSNNRACGMSKDGERHDSEAEKQQRKRSLKKTKTCNNLSVVPHPSHAISASTVNNKCNETPCNTETSMFIADGQNRNTEVNDKLDHGAHLETSLTDQVEMLIAEYKEYLARSRREDQIEEVSAIIGDNVKLENLTDGVEGPPEVHSRDDVDANAILTTQE